MAGEGPTGWTVWWPVEIAPTTFACSSGTGSWGKKKATLAWRRAVGNVGEEEVVCLCDVDVVFRDALLPLGHRVELQHRPRTVDHLEAPRLVGQAEAP